jgi:hypothetical protein
MSDVVHRRIVVEFGLLYVYLREENADGKIVRNSEEVWKQPYRLERLEALEEATQCYQFFFQWMQDHVLSSGGNLQGGDGNSPDSE